MRITRIVLVLFLLTLNKQILSSNHVDSLLRLTHLSKNDSIKVNLLNQLSKELRYINIDSAIHFAETAYELANKIHYQKGRGNSLIKLGIIYQNKGKYEKALESFTKAKNIYKNENDIEFIVKAHSNIGDIHQLMGNAELALDSYLKSLEISKDFEDKSTKIGILIDIGNFYFEQSDLQKTSEYFEKALLIADSLNSYQYQKIIHNNLGSINIMQEKYEKALFHFKNDLSISTGLDTPTDLMTSYTNIAYIYRSMGDTEKAKSYFMKCAPLIDAKKYPMMTIAYYTNLGIYHGDIDEFDTAIQYLKKTLPILENVNSLSQLKIIYSNLSNLYKMNDDYEEALSYYQLMTEVNDSLFNERKAELISEMEEKYESEKKDQAIAIKNIELREKDLKITIGIAILLGLLVFVIVYTWGKNQKQIRLKAEAKQRSIENQQRILDLMQQQEVATLTAGMEAQENERNRIARELHDSVNTLIATVKINLNGLEEEEKLLKKETSVQLIKAQELTEIASAEVRRISHNLANPIFTDGGLLGALTHLQTAINSAQIVAVELSVIGLEEANIPYSTEMELFRIVQELVKNTLKHAKATKIEIEVNAFPDSLALSISDDGVGFDPQTVVSNGMGMKSIHNRIEKLNGDFLLDSAPGRGTETTIEIPLT